MDSKLKDIWDNGEIVEIFPYKANGEQEAIVLYESAVYHIQLSEAGQPISVLGKVSDDDYDAWDDSGVDVGDPNSGAISDFWLDWVDEEDDIDPSLFNNIHDEEE